MDEEKIDRWRAKNNKDKDYSTDSVTSTSPESINWARAYLKKFYPPPTVAAAPTYNFGQLTVPLLQSLEPVREPFPQFTMSKNTEPVYDRDELNNWAVKVERLSDKENRQIIVSQRLVQQVT